MTRYILFIVPFLFVVAGCGLVTPGPSGETAPLLFGFKEVVAKAVESPPPTGILDLAGWTVGLVGAGVAGMLAQWGRIERKRRKEIVKVVKKAGGNAK
jgi:hypothetical protein